MMKVIGQIIEYLYDRGRLTRQDLVYLTAEGFFQYLEGEDEYDRYRQHDYDPYRWGDEGFDALEHAKDALNRRRSRPQPPKSALKAVDIRDNIVARRPSWAETLAPLVSLARHLHPSANLETALLLLRDAESSLVLQAMAAELKATPNWLEELWTALTFEEYRQCCGRGGDADRAYRVLLTGRSLPEITKYAWILRHPEIAWVHTLVTVQHQLTRLCGVLFETHFPRIDSYLAQTYRSKLLWPYILLYSAHRYASGTPLTPLAQECRLPREAMPNPSDFAAAMEFALEMNRAEVLPFMVYAIRAQEPGEARAEASKFIGGFPFLCSARWYKPY